jgi:UDP-glucose 4-epimerase
MRVAIIGDTGFIGSRLVNHLSSNDLKTIGFNSGNRPIGFNGILSNEVITSDSIVWTAGKINPAIAEKELGLVDKEYEEWCHFIDQLEKSDFCKLGKKIIFLSSGGCVYDYSDNPLSEESPAFGSNQYGRAKLKMEDKIQESELNYTILRVSNVYGPGQKTGKGQGVIAEWLRSSKSGEPLRVFGNLEDARDYLYVDDLCSAILLSIHNSFEGVLNIGSGVPTTLKQLVEIFTNELENEIKIEVQSSRDSDRKNYSLDISRASLVLGWKPKVDMRLAIGDLIRGVGLGK